MSTLWASTKSGRMSEAIEKRMTELRGLAGEAAKARAEREYLDEFKKSKLAMLMSAAEALGASSVAAQEREARKHPEYLSMLDGLREAVETCERCEWELRIALKGADLWQTLQANERAERRGYGA